MFPEFEEDSLVNASVDSFAELSENFSESVSEIKKNMQLMIKYKKEGINDREAYQQLRTRGCLQIAILKRLNRFAQMGAKQIREKTKVCFLNYNMAISEFQDQLTGSDGHFLKLQNLQYQAHHLQNEIDGCLNFQSAHKKVVFCTLLKVTKFQLELKAVADFNENAPESLREKAVSVEEDMTDAEKEHKLTLARLEWENEERNGGFTQQNYNYRLLFWPLKL